MEEYKQTKKGKEGWVDTLGNVSYSLAVGSALDYAAGLNGLGILASRAYATGMNLPTAAPYGKWRNFVFEKTRTTDDSSKLRKGLTDLLAFNTFQVPVYASAIAVGSLISEGKIIFFFLNPFFDKIDLRNLDNKSIQFFLLRQ